MTDKQKVIEQVSRQLSNVQLYDRVMHAILSIDITDKDDKSIDISMKVQEVLKAVDEKLKQKTADSVLLQKIAPLSANIIEECIAHVLTPYGIYQLLHDFPSIQRILLLVSLTSISMMKIIEDRKYKINSKLEKVEEDFERKQAVFILLSDAYLAHLIEPSISFDNYKAALAEQGIPQGWIDEWEGKNTPKEERQTTDENSSDTPQSNDGGESASE